MDEIRRHRKVARQVKCYCEKGTMIFIKGQWHCVREIEEEAKRAGLQLHFTALENSRKEDVKK